jgi:hypothetical protein
MSCSLPVLMREEIPCNFEASKKNYENNFVRLWTGHSTSLIDRFIQRGVGGRARSAAPAVRLPRAAGVYAMSLIIAW